MQLAPAHQIPEEHSPPLSWSHLDSSWVIRRQNSLSPIPRENFELESLSSSILLEVALVSSIKPRYMKDHQATSLGRTKNLNVVGVELELHKGS